MISRYTREEIGAVWTQQRKLETWLEVELAATDAWAAESVVSAEDAAACRERAYAGAQMIDFDGKQMRTDIAARAVERVTS